MSPMILSSVVKFTAIICIVLRKLQGVKQPQLNLVSEQLDRRAIGGGVQYAEKRLKLGNATAYSTHLMWPCCIYRAFKKYYYGHMLIVTSSAGQSVKFHHIFVTA